MVVVVPGAYVPPTAFGGGAFADFLDLRTAVVEHVANAGIADVFPRLVALAESRLNRTLRMREQVTSVDITFTDGRAPLPDDYAEMVGLYAMNGLEYVQQAMQRNCGNYYAVQGAEIVAPGIAGAARAEYYATIPTIGASLDATNWLLTRYPDVYLYSVAFEAEKYMRNAEAAIQARALMDDAIASARADDETARYSRARVRVAGVNP